MDSIVLREMKQEVIHIVYFYLLLCHSVLLHDKRVIEVAVKAGMAKKTQKCS
jgi:hypothetical protein